MAKTTDLILPIVSILRYWAIILGSFWRSRNILDPDRPMLLHRPKSHLYVAFQVQTGFHPAARPNPCRLLDARRLLSDNPLQAEYAAARTSPRSHRSRSLDKKRQLLFAVLPFVGIRCQSGLLLRNFNKLSYDNPETISFTVYPYYGNLHYVP